ncbi:type I-E CRISPR-associated protein Cas5/CasD [Streptomyces sp. SL13]|uniref:Type I-E CRISPR-associated protein Cas5/CasD n=1 Tax=Streptantibioticus silvisoli TaxID=2705255 RepID=A0AA90KEZ9_9ACTN|nr:type I-E CRISPR-associated protein Cas5/CasD [Streptantibioticus silvisoli]MDI5968610.1 type I-E CRISPR-associated protein Cas5/CasD [Streptantibioticus silvisoli]
MTAPQPPREPGLLLRLAAPLQSWGERSHFTEERDTAAFPTKSGVLGLLSCAFGRHRGEANDDLRRLGLTVRIDRPGYVLRDLHTVGGGLAVEDTVRTAKGGTRAAKASTVYGHRLYLADATFICALTCQDDALLGRCADALTTPRWPLYLGRRSCPPEGPVLLGHSPDVLGSLLRLPLPGQAPVPAVTLLADRPLGWLPRHPEDPDDGTRPSSEVQDEPVDTSPHRRAFRIRQLYRGSWHPPEHLYTSALGAAYLKALAAHLHGATAPSPNSPEAAQ